MGVWLFGKFYNLILSARADTLVPTLHHPQSEQYREFGEKDARVRQQDRLR